MSVLPRLILILGGVRSGKSERAEELVRASGLEPVYVATARPLDADMAARIARHRARRGSRWRSVEAPLEPDRAIRQESTPGRAVLVDGLGVWLTNLLVEGVPVDARVAAFTRALDAAHGPVVLVSEEVGLGPIAADRLTRELVDRLGALNRTLAARAGRVELVVAGLPLVLREGGSIFE